MRARQPRPALPAYRHVAADRPAVEAARFAFDGSETAFWSWLGGPPQVFTRSDWEQI